MTEKKVDEQNNLSETDATEENTETSEKAAPEQSTEVEQENPELDKSNDNVAEASSSEEEASEASNSDEEVTETASESNENNTPPPAHDDFDWSVDKRNVSAYTDNERQELESLYTTTLKSVNENEIISGMVVGITNADVVLNIGFKSDGLVPLSEFRDKEDLKVGDEVDVYVMEKEDTKGQLVLSRKNAKLLLAWEKIVEAYNTDTVVTGTVSSKTKGGLIANVFGLETFLPGSQIDVKPIIDYDSYVGKTMEFKVVKVNESIKNAVVSHKALIESDLEDQRQEIISKLEKGQVLEGTIKNITDFGAFIDLGGVDGLLYITDISWGRISHPSEVLELNQKLNVVVLEFDDDKKRISLGLKQLQPHPWDTLDDKIEVGSKIKGKVVNIEDYGAFLELTPGVEGLIHVSEVTWSNQPINARDYFNINEEYEAIVMSVDREERKMALSLKRLTPDPWTKVTEKYQAGTKHKGNVQNITPYGVFIELEEGIGGMIHISDLSWVKRFNHPSEFTKVGEVIDVVVLEIDDENRKLSLGHKQIEEDPWDTFEDVFPVGSVHEATVLSKEDKGSIILLPYGLEAFAPAKHMKKENGQPVEADEKLEFKVIDFNRNDKRIIVSHSRIWEDHVREEKRETSKRSKEQSEKARKSVKKMSRQVEKTTLGDLGILSEIKQKMEEDDAPAKKSKKAVKEDPAAKEEKKAEEKKVEEKKVEEKKAEEKEVEEKAEAKADKNEKKDDVVETPEDVKSESENSDSESKKDPEEDSEKES